MSADLPSNESQEPEWDVFLSYASEDRAWCEALAERLRNEGVRVWFDQWRLQAGHHLDVEINKALDSSRKLVAVWSPHYFGKEWTQAETFSQHHGALLGDNRPVVPICIVDRETLKIPPTLRPFLSLDFTNADDFEIRIRQLMQALDLPKRDSSQDLELVHGRFDYTAASERGRRAHKKGKRFEEEVATLYRLLGFEVVPDTNVCGMQIDLQIKKREGGLTTQAVVECKDTRVTAKERDQLIAQQVVTSKELPRHRWIAVSSVGFAAETRNALEGVGFDCTTYAELLRDLVPLDNYVEHLIRDYEEWVADEKGWSGRDLFIRPDIETDVSFEKRPALTHWSKWLGDTRGNLLVVLGDLGTGKSTLSKFLAYQLARSFRDDPLRHPAPVLIPLGEVRKEVSLDGIVVKHFRDRGIPGLNFPRFEHLVRQGKIVLFFDAFDEMADRVRWDITQANFQELRRAADGVGKVVLTCRTHYFKDRTEQSKLIGQGPSLTAAETALYKELRQQSNAEVVYLQEFNEDQIKAYLQKTRGKKADADWRKIQTIYNLRDLASRPLLLDLIVKSLPKLHEGQAVNASNLYTVYTNIWVERDFKKGRVVLDQATKLALMTELAWVLWRDEKISIMARELATFVAKLHSDRTFEFGEDEVEDIAREVQAASFLRRDRDGGEFHFIHRSFGEFFLAKKLLASLTDTPTADTPVLKTRRFDRKVIYFLAR